MLILLGKYTANSKQWLLDNGFEIQVLTKYGTVNKSSSLDLTNLGRIRCQQDVTGEDILNIIERNGI